MQKKKYKTNEDKALEKLILEKQDPSRRSLYHGNQPPATTTYPKQSPPSTTTTAGSHSTSVNNQRSYTNNNNNNNDLCIINLNYGNNNANTNYKSSPLCESALLASIHNSNNSNTNHNDLIASFKGYYGEKESQAIDNLKEISGELDEDTTQFHNNRMFKGISQNNTIDLEFNIEPDDSSFSKNKTMNTNLIPNSKSIYKHTQIMNNGHHQMDNNDNSFLLPKFYYDYQRKLCTKLIAIPITNYSMNIEFKSIISPENHKNLNKPHHLSIDHQNEIAARRSNSVSYEQPKLIGFMNPISPLDYTPDSNLPKDQHIPNKFPRAPLSAIKPISFVPDQLKPINNSNSLFMTDQYTQITESNENITHKKHIKQQQQQELNEALLEKLKNSSVHLRKVTHFDQSIYIMNEFFPQISLGNNSSTNTNTNTSKMPFLNTGENSDALNNTTSTTNTTTAAATCSSSKGNTNRTKGDVDFLKKILETTCKQDQLMKIGDFQQRMEQKSKIFKYRSVNKRRLRIGNNQAKIKMSVCNVRELRPLSVTNSRNVSMLSSNIFTNNQKLSESKPLTPRISAENPHKYADSDEETFQKFRDSAILDNKIYRYNSVTQESTSPNNHLHFHPHHYSQHNHPHHTRLNSEPTKPVYKTKNPKEQFKSKKSRPISYEKLSELLNHKSYGTSTENIMAMQDNPNPNASFIMDNTQIKLPKNKNPIR